MPDVLIYADTLRSAELRHEVPLSIGDPFLYAEHDGARHLVVSALEMPRLDGSASSSIRTRSSVPTSSGAAG